MEFEEVVRWTGLYFISSGHQFGTAGRGSVKDQGKPDPGQTGGVPARRQDRQTPDQMVDMPDGIGMHTLRKKTHWDLPVR